MSGLETCGGIAVKQAAMVCCRQSLYNAAVAGLERAAYLIGISAMQGMQPDNVLLTAGCHRRKPLNVLEMRNTVR